MDLQWGDMEYALVPEDRCMNNRRSQKAFSRKAAEQSGSTLVELMIAMVVLAIGLGSLTVLFIGVIETNNKNSKDTTATLLSQMVLEALSAQHPTVTTPIVITDCAGNAWTVANGSGGAVNTPAGVGASLVSGAGTAGYGGIDWTQAYNALPPASSVTSGYGMRYVDCGQNGRQTVYEVRWNVMTIDANQRLITVSSRQLGSNNGGMLFTLPITLRGMGGV